ncbi:putative mitochondrial protein, partial [Mucuna pruriens]
MVEDKVIILGPNELLNLVSSYCLDDRNYLQWVQYIRTTLKGCKKLSHIEEKDPPRDDPKIYNGDGKGPTKRSTSEEKPFTKSSHGKYCMYCKRSGHTKDTCYKRYGKEKVLERMSGNKNSTQMWVNQTTSNKESGVEHTFTLQLDQDIQAFNKGEMDRLQALLNSTSKPLGSCGLTMNCKSSFNISGSVPQNILILDSRVTDHMTWFPSCFTSHFKVPKRQLITVANGDHVPIAGSGNVLLHPSLSLHNELTTRRTVGIAKEQDELYYLQHTKIGESYLEVELVIESLPFPSQDVQVQEVMKLTLVPKQVQMSELDVSIPDNSIEEQVQLSKLEEALKDENWVQVMKEEMEALEKNSTWEIVHRSKDKRVVGCRWIYTVKRKSDETLERNTKQD